MTDERADGGSPGHDLSSEASLVAPPRPSLIEAALCVVGDALVVVDVDGAVRAFNGAAERLTGWTAAQAVGQPLSAVLEAEVEPGAVSGATTDALVRVSSTRSPEARPLQATVTPLHGATGELLGALWRLRDIPATATVAPLAEEDAERFRVCFEHGPGARSMMSPDGRLLRVNRAFVDLVGYSAQELQTTPLADLTHPDDRPECVESLRTLLAGERDEVEWEARYLHREGRVVWAWVTTRLQRSPDGAPLYFLTHTHDLTELRSSQRRLEHMARLLSAIRNINQLILRERDADRLIQKACDLLVRRHGYRAAWIARAGTDDAPTRWAQAGWEEAFAPIGHRLAASAWPPCRRFARDAQDGLALIEPSQHCQTCPLGLDYAGHTAVAVCLRHDGRDLGMLAVMLAARNAIDADERGLLLEVAADLGFGLSSIDSEHARRLAEDAVHRAATDYRTLAEHIPDLVTRYDTDLRHTYVNPAAARAGVLAPEGYLGKRIGETGVPHEVAEAWEGRLRVVIATRTAMEVQSDFDTAEGHRHFVTSLVPEPAPDGTVQSVLSLARDVTAQRQAAIALQQQKDFIERLVETARTIILVLDVEGRIVTFNRHLEQLSGYSAAEMRGKAWVATMLPERDRSQVAAFFRQAIEGAPIGTHINPIVTRDGLERQIEWSNVLLRDDAGAVVGALATGQDVTDRLQMEGALKESLRETIVLLAASRAILHERDPRHTLCQILQIAAEHLGARSGYLALLAEGGRADELLVLGSESGFRPMSSSDAEVQERGLLRLMAAADAAVVGAGAIERSEGADVLHAPLKAGGLSIGLLGLAGKTGGFSERDTEMAAAFSEVMAIALREHRTRKALEVSEEQHRALFASSADALMTLAPPSWRFTACNPATLRMFGVESEDAFVSLGPWELAPPTQPDGRPSQAYVTEMIQVAMERGSHHFDWTCTRSSGESFPSAVLLTRLEIHGQELLQATVRDITEQRRVESLEAARIVLLEYSTDHTMRELLRKALDEIERVTDSQVAFFHFMEPDQKTLTLQVWSSATVERFCQADGEEAHYDVDEAGVWVDCVRHRRPVIHNDCASLPNKRGLPEGHATVLRELVVPVFRGGSIVAIVGVGNKPGDYTEQDVHTVSSLADVAWEIAQRKLAEVAREQLMANLAQSDRLASMGMLAAGVAHEINNPLSFVLYNLESLVEDFPRLTLALGVAAGEGGDASSSSPREQPLEDVLERLEAAVSGTRRIKQIVRGLSTFSRVERTELAAVEVSSSLDHALAMAANELKVRARVVKDYAPVPEVLASDGKLAQVFLNLLVNAAHAIDEGDVAGNEVRLRLFLDGDRVCVEVGDTGKGIAPEHRDTVFEPFFTTKPVGTGSGLGLSICRSIVTEFGGTLSFTSEVGVGTRFLVALPRIPLAERQVPTTPPTSSATVASVRGRILVIDDEEGIRVIIKRMLGRSHDLVLCESGVAAQELLSRDRAFDLILCDLMMPQMSGMDLHAWLATVDPALAAQLVFVTGGAFTAGASQYLDSVPNLRLEKPFEMAAFIATANDLVRASKMRQRG